MRHEPVSLGDTLVRVMLQIALAQPDAAERDGMLQIMRDDGWLPQEEQAA